MQQERIMSTRGRTLPLMLVALAMLVVGACGGDDSKAEKKTRDQEAAVATTATNQGTSNAGTPSGAVATTPAPATSSRSLQLDCGKDLKAFRFNGRLAVKLPESGGAGAADPAALIASVLTDVKYSGAFLAPDRSQLKLETSKDSVLGGQAIEFVQIGGTSYTKLGNTAWQQSSGNGTSGGLLDSLDPREFCKSLEQNLKGDVPSRKEKVNGVDAIRYDYDRKTLEGLGGFLGGVSGNGDELPENAKLNLWVSEKEKFPVKITFTGSGQQDGGPYSLDLELNVTDLNSSGVRVDAPR